MTGSTSSLIDKTFYGGSLDFIEINNLFVADFKDIYINLAIFTFIIIIYNSDNNKFENDIIEIKRFIKFIITDIKINILKIKKDSS
jgi:signal peptidase II